MVRINKATQLDPVGIRPQARLRPSWADMTLSTHPYMYETDEKTGMPWFLVRDLSRHPHREAEVDLEP